MEPISTGLVVQTGYFNIRFRIRQQYHSATLTCAKAQAAWLLISGS